MILTIPCLFLSAAAAHRIYRMQREMQRSRYSSNHASIPRLHSTLQAKKEEQDIPLERVRSPVPPIDKALDRGLLDSPQSAGAGDVFPLNVPDVSPSVTFGTSQRQSATWEALGSIEEEDVHDPRRQMGSMMISCKLRPPNRGLCA